VAELLRCEFMQSTTTCCESCQAWAAWHTATKQHNKKTKKTKSNWNSRLILY
jgi:hypothetical protein